MPFCASSLSGSPFFLLLLTLKASAQIPNTVLHSIIPPPTGVQFGAQLGYSVAADGDLTVAGAPFDDTGTGSAGVAKVFDSFTGKLLHVLPNPSPALNDNFGDTVAISGTRVVVGCRHDDTAETEAGIAYVFDVSRDQPDVPVATLNNPAPFWSDHFGNAVAISGTRVVVGAWTDDAATADAGTAYVFDLASATPEVPVLTIVNPEPASSDRFGSSVAISGTQVVVGAPNDDTNSPDAGAAYVFDLSAASPAIPAVKLTSPAPAMADNFGAAVAISGARVVVGVPRDDTGAPNAGSAYVFDVTAATPAVPIAALHNPDPVATDNFGTSTAIAGTLIVVGNPYVNQGPSQPGSICVYDLNSGTPRVPVATLNNPTPVNREYFGYAVAVTGTRVMVGDYYDSTGNTQDGSVFVFDFSAGSPATPAVTLRHLGASTGDNFGTSVAVSGTLAVIGSPWDDTAGINAGSAFIYNLGSSTPTVPVHALSNPNNAVANGFGGAVAISGMKVVVGAGGNNGRAYVYDLAGAHPTVPIVSMSNPGGGWSEGFGGAVAIDGNRVVVGAGWTDAVTFDEGRAYVYNLSSNTPAVPAVILRNPGPGSYEYFGSAVAISGDRVVVGAYGENTGDDDTGSAYVFNLTSATPGIPVFTLNNPRPGYADSFGNAVAISGTRVVIGAYRDDDAAYDSGSAFVYDLSSSTPTVPEVTLYKPNAGGTDYFGDSVAISGTRVAVGMGVGAGSVFIYDLLNGAPATPATILNSPVLPTAGDHFGRGVAMDGATLVVGAPGEDSPQLDKGAAYIFGPAPDADHDGLLDAWEMTWWPETGGHGPMDDFDNDGVVELLELAFGLNPTVPDADGLPVATIEDSYLTMTLTKRAGVVCQVQSAGTPQPGQPDSFSGASTTVLLNSATTLKVRDNTPINSAVRRFMRVSVTASP
jgi:hypothetical protein